MTTANTLSSVSLAFTLRSVLFLCRAGCGLGGRCLVMASDPSGPDASGSRLGGSGLCLTIFSFVIEVYSSFLQTRFSELVSCMQSSLCEYIHTELGFLFSWRIVLIVISFCLSSRNAKILNGKRWQLTKLLSLTF